MYKTFFIDKFNIFIYLFFLLNKILKNKNKCSIFFFDL